MLLEPELLPAFGQAVAQAATAAPTGPIYHQSDYGWGPIVTDLIARGGDGAGDLPGVGAVLAGLGVRLGDGAASGFGGSLREGDVALMTTGDGEFTRE